jgi:hypothetical protein
VESACKIAYRIMRCSIKVKLFLARCRKKRKILKTNMQRQFVEGSSCGSIITYRTFEMGRRI